MDYMSVLHTCAWKASLSKCAKVNVCTLPEHGRLVVTVAKQLGL